MTGPGLAPPVTDLMRGLLDDLDEVRALPDDDPRRVAWRERKRALLARMDKGWS